MISVPQQSGDNGKIRVICCSHHYNIIAFSFVNTVIKSDCERSLTWKALGS